MFVLKSLKSLPRQRPPNPCSIIRASPGCETRPGANIYSRLYHATPTPQTPNGFKLRDYQENAVQNVLDAVNSGIKRPVVVLATGGGKTVVMSHLIPQIPPPNSARTKTLVLAHKEELVRQTARTLRAMNPCLRVDIDMSKQKPGPDADVVIGSVNTLVRLTRLHKYDPNEYKAIVLDECHHAPAQSWTKILNHFEALEPHSEIVVLGFTATLERTDGKALGDVFQKVVYQRDLREMIREKELCDARFSTMKVDLNLEEVAVKSGDFDISALSEAVNSADINAQVAKAYLQLRKELKFKSTLVFCVDIAHCKTLCGVLQAHGINAQYVTGETAKHVRQDVLEQFKKGKIDVLCNVMVFTEGTDIPNIDSLVLARPTKSRPLLTQMIGRGLRLHKGKDMCHVIDMVNTMKVGVSSVPTLFGLPAHHKFDKKSFAELEADKETVDLIKEQEKEKALAKERADDVRRLIEYQEQLKDIELKFDVISGFATMITKRNTDLKEYPKQVLEAFRNCGFDWVRLEYDIWGIPLSNTDSFLTIERIHSDAEGVEFKLSKVEPASFQALKASNYQCPRRSSFLINEGSLEYLLTVATSVIGRRPFTPKVEKKVSVKQAEYITRGLRKRVNSMYGLKRGAEFADTVKAMTMSRASNLIFAMKWSVQSLWVTWELKNLLGLTLRLEKLVAKKHEKIRAHKERLNLQDDKNQLEVVNIGQE